MTVYKVGQKIKITHTVYGGAVYDRKGNITNANDPGIKKVNVGFIDSITVEGKDTSFEGIYSNSISPIEKAYGGAVKFRIIREKADPMNIYPLRYSIGKQEIEILEDVEYPKNKIVQALAVPQGEGEPSRLSYDEIIEIHNKYSIVGIIETYREIEMAVLEKNGFEPKTIQFDWDYLDSLLKGDK